MNTDEKLKRKEKMKVIVILFVAVALFSAFAECRITDRDNKLPDTEEEDEGIDVFDLDFTPWLGPFSLSPPSLLPPPRPPQQDGEL